MKKICTKLMIMFLCMISFTACTQYPADIGNKNQQNIEQGEELVREDKSTDQTDLSPVDDIEENEKHEVVLYFSDQDLMNTYRVKKEIEVGKDEQVEKAALESWIKGPDHKELSGLISSDTMVEYVKDVDGIAHVSFSKEIQESNLGSTGELMLAEQIAMIMEQFGFKKTQILVEGEIVGTLLGHLYTEEPIEANAPEDYQWITE